MWNGIKEKSRNKIKELISMGEREYQKKALLCIADGLTVTYNKQGIPVLVEDKDAEQNVDITRAIVLGYRRIKEERAETEEQAKELQSEIERNRQLKQWTINMLMERACFPIKELKAY